MWPEKVELHGGPLDGHFGLCRPGAAEVRVKQPVFDRVGYAIRYVGDRLLVYARADDGRYRYEGEVPAWD